MLKRMRSKTKGKELMVFVSVFQLWPLWNYGLSTDSVSRPSWWEQDSSNTPNTWSYWKGEQMCRHESVCVLSEALFSIHSFFFHFYNFIIIYLISIMPPRKENMRHFLHIKDEICHCRGSWAKTGWKKSSSKTSR